MKKLSLNPPMKQYPLSLTPRHIEMLGMFIVQKGFTSRSDAARYAIMVAFEKCFPDYVYKLTPAGQLKAAKSEVQAALDSMTDEDFILSDEVQGKIYVATDGVRKVALHSIGNSVKVIPLEGAKALLTDQDIFLKDHRDGMASHGTVDGSVTGYLKSILLSEYQIDLDHQPAPDAAAEEKI
jgi:hypothetical protein